MQDLRGERVAPILASNAGIDRAVLVDNAGPDNPLFAYSGAAGPGKLKQPMPLVNLERNISGQAAITGDSPVFRPFAVRPGRPKATS